MALMLVAIILGNAASARAQFTFMGDYDKTFAAPLGYYVDPQEPVPTVSTFQTLFYTGEYAPDGSIIAGGRHVNATNPVLGTFYIRKFNAAGAPDLAFGSNGFVRTTFFTGSVGNQLFPSNDTPRVLRVQPDGKILFAGECSGITTNDLPAFGNDACVLRYNADGSIDAGFGNVSVLVGGGLGPGGAQVPTSIIDIGPGRFITQTGVIIAPGNPGPRRGTNGRFTDMAIQPDGKIVLVGETRNEYSNAYAQVAFIMRLNPNGMLDSTFGTNGMVQMAANPVAPNCYPNTGFFGVRLQADGRIIALGYDGVVNNNDCSTGGNYGNRFLVTRWTANGQAETLRRLDNNNTFASQRERATTAFFTRDGSKLVVSGSYNFKATLVRLNVADLSIDTTFGTNGIRGYAEGQASTPGFFNTLYIKEIQPDGRIIGSDDANVFNSNGVVRFNPDGSSDQSFGNIPFEGNNPGLRGRLRLDVPAGNPMQSNAHVLVRPNGRINLLGYAGAFNGVRAVVSQQNTVFKNGIYADFTNDGKAEISVFRPSDGVWHQLNSANNNYSAVKWGISIDKIAPADYDGDGRTDLAVFRDGIWYIYQSSNNQVRIENFGLAGDLPRPGDFDGDGRADISVFRPSNGVWYRINSSNGQFAAIQFGLNGDHPMLGDYDADGKTDFAVYRPSNSVWYILRSSDFQVRIDVFGSNGDIPLNGDFNGDAISDLAVFRPSNRTWYIARPSGIPGQNFDSFVFGISTDMPVPADYDNDGKTDLAVYRGGVWWIQQSGNGQVSAISFGLNSDKPIPAAYLP